MDNALLHVGCNFDFGALQPGDISRVVKGTYYSKDRKEELFKVAKLAHQQVGLTKGLFPQVAITHPPSIQAFSLPSREEVSAKRPFIQSTIQELIDAGIMDLDEGFDAEVEREFERATCYQNAPCDPEAGASSLGLNTAGETSIIESAQPAQLRFPNLQGRETPASIPR